MWDAAKLQNDMIAFLHGQQQSNTAELAQTHHALGKLYKKLSRIERALAECEKRQLRKREKRKLQWARSVTSRTVEQLEGQRQDLHECFAQCNDLLASYGEEAGTNHAISPTTLGTAQPPPPRLQPLQPPSGFCPFSTIPQNPSAVEPGPMGMSCGAGHAQYHQRPQYWDIPVRREKGKLFTNASVPESAPHELATQSLSVAEEGFTDPNHVFAHELMSPTSSYSPSTAEASRPGTGRKESSTSGKTEDVPQRTKLNGDTMAMMGPSSTAHRRRHSETAIQITEGISKIQQQKRSMSAGPV